MTPHDPLIQSVIEERKLQRWGLYALPQAAEIYGVDEATLKRWKKAGIVQGVPHGPRGVRFPGWMIAKWIAYGVEERRKGKTKFEGVDRRKSA